MTTELSQIVRSFSGQRVLLIGDLILDRYIYGHAERVSPEAPVPVLRTVEKKEAVGGCANVAACLAALGVRVECCGVVGLDNHGKRLTAMLGDLAVETAGVLALTQRPTTTKTRLVGLAQHRHRQQLLRVDEEDTSALDDDLNGQIISAACAAVDRADVVCIEDYDKGVVTRTLVEAVLEVAQKNGKPVLVDPARLTCYDRYAGADVLTPNREELSIATHKTLSTVEEVADAASSMLQSVGVGAIVVTLDRQGAAVIERHKAWMHIPTVPRSVYDNTGAGDAVLAMLAAAISAGAQLQDAVRLANVAGGLEVERFGCVPITSDEILAELRLEDRQRNGKLRSVDDLVGELSLRRDRGETVVFTNGCYDILHAGHVDFLKRCRREGSILVVAINTDDSVRMLGKGDGRPINRFENRASVVSALECVDYTVGFSESDPEALIRKIRPDVLVKGEDWASKGVVGSDFVKKNGGKVVLLPLVEGLSTTELIRRIRNEA